MSHFTVVLEKRIFQSFCYFVNYIVGFSLQIRSQAINRGYFVVALFA